jgi:predicted transcriptional regulator
VESGRGFSFAEWFQVKRQRLNILADVLNAAGKGARKTRIMQNANLSFALLEKYLGESMSLEFLRPNHFGYEITQKGQTFLEQYNELHSRHSQARKLLDSCISEWQAFERSSMAPTNGGVRCAQAKWIALEKKVRADSRLKKRSGR